MRFECLPVGKRQIALVAIGELFEAHKAFTQRTQAPATAPTPAMTAQFQWNMRNDQREYMGASLAGQKCQHKGPRPGLLPGARVSAGTLEPSASLA